MITFLKERFQKWGKSDSKPIELVKQLTGDLFDHAEFDTVKKSIIRILEANDPKNTIDYGKLNIARFPNEFIIALNKICELFKTWRQYEILKEIFKADLQLRWLESERLEINWIRSMDEYIQLYQNMNNLVRFCDVPSFLYNYLAIALRPNLDASRNRILIKCADWRTSSVAHFAPNFLIQLFPKIRPTAWGVISPILADLNDWKSNKWENIDIWNEINEILNNPERSKLKDKIFDEIETFLWRQLRHRRLMAQASTLAWKIQTLWYILHKDTDGYFILDSVWNRINIIPKVANAISNLQKHNRKDKRVFDMVPSEQQEEFKDKIDALPMHGYPTLVEYQSHSSETQWDWCWRWGCNNSKALQMTAINAIFTQAFLEERYPDLVKPGEEQVKVVRTNHITWAKERIVSASRSEEVDPIDKGVSKLIWNQFKPIYYKNSSEQIVRERVRNWVETVHTDRHYEQTIRVTAYPKAARYQWKVSTLEQAFLPDVKKMHETIWTLIWIVQRHRIKEKNNEWKKEPIIVHLDCPKPNISLIDGKLTPDEEVMRKVRRFDKLNKLLKADEWIQEMISSWNLIIVRSVTSWFDLTEEFFDPRNVYETTFLAENWQDNWISYKEFVDEMHDREMIQSQTLIGRTKKALLTKFYDLLTTALDWTNKHLGQ